MPIKYSNLLHFIVFNNSQTFLFVLCLIPEVLYENVKYHCHLTDENIQVENSNLFKVTELIHNRDENQNRIF